MSATGGKRAYDRGGDVEDELEAECPNCGHCFAFGGETGGGSEVNEGLLGAQERMPGERGDNYRRSVREGHDADDSEFIRALQRRGGWRNRK